MTYFLYQATQSMMSYINITTCISLGYLVCIHNSYSKCTQDSINYNTLQYLGRRTNGQTGRVRQLDLHMSGALMPQFMDGKTDRDKNKGSWQTSLLLKQQKTKNSVSQTDSSLQYIYTHSNTINKYTPKCQKLMAEPQV